VGVIGGEIMTKLNQIIAVANGQKGRTQKAITEAHHKVQKDQLTTGISRTYRPKDEDGEKLPPESKLVNYRVSDAIRESVDTLTTLFDIVATQDRANCLANADVVVGEKTILVGVPVTHLLFLEKQLVDIHTLVDKLPALDPSEEWEFSAEADCYATKPHETTRTKKIPKAFVKYEATKEHPAQVETFHEDVLVGYWETIKFSGAIPESEKRAMLTRIRKLQDAVKAAREEANGMEITQYQVGSKIFDYLFG
jgi:hypothetical protein